MQDNRNQHQATLDQRQRQSRPEQIFHREGILRLRRLCQLVDADTSLPTLWTELAAAHRSARVIAVQAEIDRLRRPLGVNFRIPVTVPLVMKMFNLALSSANPADPRQGIGPFQFGLLLPELAEQIEQRTFMYQLLTAGEGVPACADLRVMEAPDDARVARSISDLQHSLRGLQVVMAAMFGVGHDVVAFLRTVDADLDNNIGRLEPLVAQQRDLPVHMQWYVHTYLMYWMESQQDSDTPIPFRPVHFVPEAAMGGISWQRVLPPSIRFVRPQAPSYVPGQPGQPPSTTPPAAATPTPNPAKGNSVVTNPAFDERFAPIRARVEAKSKEVKDRCILKKVKFPVGDNGAFRCLPYHLKGQCNEGCKSSHDHHGNHSAASQQTLLDWAMLHWTGPQ